MTSNLGGDIIQRAERIDAVKGEIGMLLKATFKPEFLNRIDETIYFNRLGQAEIGKIVDLQLAILKERLAEKKISLELTPRAKSHIAEAGYDPQFGARPLKRTVQNLLQNPLAKRILAGEASEGDSIVADVDSKGEIVFKKKAHSGAAAAAAGGPAQSAGSAPAARKSTG
jgi:ATP-dependent Clp protease ATP-binding subunit ClpB